MRARGRGGGVQKKKERRRIKPFENLRHPPEGSEAVCAPRLREKDSFRSLLIISDAEGGSKGAWYVRMDFRRAPETKGDAEWRRAPPTAFTWARNFRLEDSEHNFGRRCFEFRYAYNPCCGGAGGSTTECGSWTRAKMRRTGFEPAPPKRSVP